MSEVTKVFFGKRKIEDIKKSPLFLTPEELVEIHKERKKNFEKDWEVMAARNKRNVEFITKQFNKIFKKKK